MVEETKAGYEITVNGTYHAATDRGKVLKTFSNETFFLPETMIIQTGYEFVNQKIDGKLVRRAQPVKKRVNSLRNAMHIIQRLLLNSRLQDKYRDCAGFRTCNIVQTRRVNKPISQLDTAENIPIEKMSLAQLRQLCQVEGIGLDVMLFSDVDEARKAVKDELENLKLAAQKMKLAEQKRQDPDLVEPELDEDISSPVSLPKEAPVAVDSQGNAIDPIRDEPIPQGPSPDKDPLDDLI